MKTVDLALWLTPVSSWPEIVAFLDVDPFVLPFEVVQAFMQEHHIPVAWKAAIGMGTSRSLRRFYGVEVELLGVPLVNRTPQNTNA